MHIGLRKKMTKKGALNTLSIEKLKIIREIILE
jgi:hypothetical protein